MSLGKFVYQTTASLNGHSPLMAPIPTGFVALPGRAMSIGDVAARDASWAKNALEPSADVVRDIGVLAVVECLDRHGQDTDTDEHKYPRAQAHIGLLGSRNSRKTHTKTRTKTFLGPDSPTKCEIAHTYLKRQNSRLRRTTRRKSLNEA